MCFCEFQSFAKTPATYHSNRSKDEKKKKEHPVNAEYDPGIEYLESILLDLNRHRFEPVSCHEQFDDPPNTVAVYERQKARHHHEERFDNPREDRRDIPS